VGALLTTGLGSAVEAKTFKVKTGAVSAEFVRGEKYARKKTVIRRWHIESLGTPFLNVETNWRSPGPDGKEVRAPGTHRWSLRSDETWAALGVPDLGFKLFAHHRKGAWRTVAQRAYLVKKGDELEALREETGVITMEQRLALTQSFLLRPTGMTTADGGRLIVVPAEKRDLIDPVKARAAAEAAGIGFVLEEHSSYVPTKLFDATVERGTDDLRVVIIDGQLSMDSPLGHELYLSGPWTRDQERLPVQTLRVLAEDPREFTLTTSFDLDRLDRGSLVSVLEHALQLGTPEVLLDELPRP
jgi:hypothetical protein